MMSMMCKGKFVYKDKSVMLIVTENNGIHGVEGKVCFADCTRGPRWTLVQIR